MLHEFLASIRIALASIGLCVVGYGGAVLAGAAAIAPEGRLGSLAEVDGRIVGSVRVAQAFTRPEYAWPRPSAVGYAADAAGGSNLSPANPAIRERAVAILEGLGATEARPAPAELALASGSGLDPHITERAAVFQAERIAAARGVAPARVVEVIGKLALPIGPGDADRIVNVLLLNLALDERMPAHATSNASDRTANSD